MNNTASPKTAGGRPSRYTFKHTLHACYTGYISQAIVNNLAPLLFVIFQQQYGLTFEEVGRLILLNFGTQIIVDVISVKLVDKIGCRAATVAAHVFAAAGLIGLGCLLFGLKGQNLNLPNVLLLSGILCMACYFVTVFSPSPILSLLACAVCGLSVSLMWPGTLSMTAARFPAGGTAMFGVMAICGDMGASAGPWLTGVISNFAQSTPAIQALSERTGESLTQLGLKSGLLVGILFPVLLVVGVILFKACYRRLQHD